MDRAVIKYDDFAQLQQSELTSHSEKWIKFQYFLDGEWIDRNTLLPLGAVHHLGNYYVTRFSLNDSTKTFTVYLSKNPSYYSK